MNTQETARILDAVAKDFIPDDIDLLPQILARFESRTFIQSLRARPALLILFVLLALGLLSGVVYALGRSLGYIPGVGLVDQSTAMRVLVEPVSVERDGIQLTVSAVVLSSDKSVLLYTIENVPWSALSHDERVAGRLSTPELHLPDGEVLHIKEGGGTSTDYRFSYAAIPASAKAASFVLPCIMNTLPGLAPENWVLPLHFKPAPADMTVAPVIVIAPTPTVSQPLITPAAASLYGISLHVDQFITLADGYYLAGHTEWTDERIQSINPPGEIQARDASGQAVALEDVNGQVAGMAQADNQWVYKIYGKVFHGPLTLHVNQLGLTFKDPARLSLDLRPYNFSFSDDKIGLPYEIGLIPLAVPGLMVNVSAAAYMKSGDQRGFKFSFDADPRLQMLGLGIESGLDTSAMTTGASLGNSSYRDEQTGVLISDVITDAPMVFPIVFTVVDAGISGDWTVSWTPPAAAAGDVAFIPETACVTQDIVKQALKNPVALPPAVAQRVLVFRDALAPDPSLFLTNLDGSQQRALVFGNGSLSPGASRLVYNDQKDRLAILDLSSGQTRLLTQGHDNTPFWSPDGLKIAFIHQTDRGQNIFVMDADGQNQRALTDLTSNPILAGWLENGQKLLLSNGLELQTIDVLSGQKQTLLVAQAESYGYFSASPDNYWLAYHDKVIGKTGGGIYLARLDGSQKRLLVQLGDWVATSPVFSPDGKWLAIGVLNITQPVGRLSSLLVNLETCQTIPLTALDGEIRAWVK